MTDADQKQGGWWSRTKTWQKVLMVGGGIFLLLIIVAGISGSDVETASGDTTTSAPSTSTSEGESPEITTTVPETTTTTVPETTTTESSQPGIGDAVRDGQFEFVVSEIEEPGDVYNPDGTLEDEASGKWFIVHVTIENIGDAEQTFFSGDQKVLWDEKEFTAEAFAFNGTSVESLNPGIVVDAIVMFDVPDSFPEGGVGTVLELHDSAFSNGVNVHL